MSEDIRIEKRNGVATVTIDREERRNALDHNAVDSLRRALAEIAANGTKVMVLTGAGTKSFCASDDLKAYAEARTKNRRLTSNAACGS